MRCQQLSLVKEENGRGRTEQTLETEIRPTKHEKLARIGGEEREEEVPALRSSMRSLSEWIGKMHTGAPRRRRERTDGRTGWKK